MPVALLSFFPFPENNYKLVLCCCLDTQLDDDSVSTGKVGIQFFQTIEASVVDCVVLYIAIFVLGDAVFLRVTRPRRQWHKALMAGKNSVKFRNIRIIKTGPDKCHFQIVMPQYFGDSPEINKGMLNGTEEVSPILYPYRFLVAMPGA
jgi:hypothetical protein